MMLTTKARYAIMAIVEMASLQDDKPTTLSEIAQKLDITQNYLEQIFSMLRRANLVRAVKGPGGGYLLNLNCDELTIVKIVDAVNENIKMTRCANNNSGCIKGATRCKTHSLWESLSFNIRNHLAAISINDVLIQNNKIERCSDLLRS